jgi:arsenate reductase (glutaredoxin)
METVSMPDDAGAGRAILYAHPDCSKSRRAVELLQSRGLEFERRDYVARPLDAAELRRLIAALDGPARGLVRTDDARERGLAACDELTEVEVVGLLLAHPELMQRPVLQVGARALVARPPERVLELA